MSTTPCSWKQAKPVSSEQSQPSNARSVTRIFQDRVALVTTFVRPASALRGSTGLPYAMGNGHTTEVSEWKDSTCTGRESMDRAGTRLPANHGVTCPRHPLPIAFDRCRRAGANADC